MKNTFIKMLIALGLVLAFAGCDDDDKKLVETLTQTSAVEIPPSVSDTDNFIAYINIDVIGVTTSSATVNVQGGDDDGVTKVDTYIIDAYKLANNVPNYVVEKVSKDFDAKTDTAFDFNVEFLGLYDNKLYIVRTVAYTVNGMTVTEEKVSMNNYVRTDANPTPTTDPVDPDPVDPDPVDPDPVDPVTNTAPTCEDFTVDAGGWDSTHSEDLTPYIHDTDVGDTLTASYEGSGVLAGDPVIDYSNTDVQGNSAFITVTSGYGDAYIDYTVSDDKGATSEPCRGTITRLNGE